MATRSDIGKRCFIVNSFQWGLIEAVDPFSGKIISAKVKTPTGDQIVSTINLIVLIITAIDKLTDVVLPLVDKIKIWWKNRK